jgi:hypothetical protein
LGDRVRRFVPAAPHIAVSLRLTLAVRLKNPGAELPGKRGKQLVGEPKAHRYVRAEGVKGARSAGGANRQTSNGHD